MRLLPFFCCISLFCSEESLVDPEFISKHLTFEAPYETTHGALDDYLGVGMIYYSIVYAKRAKICVCIGSGGGFVPRIMRQAQRDLKLQDSKTLLIDGNIGDFGRPLWLSQNSFFRKNYPDIECIIAKSHETSLALQGKIRIDYLHIDADHSEEGCWQDFIDYLPLMNPNSVITIHDTADLTGGPPKVVDRLKTLGYEIIDFKELGAGTAIVKIN